MHDFDIGQNTATDKKIGPPGVWHWTPLFRFTAAPLHKHGHWNILGKFNPISI